MDTMAEALEWAADYCQRNKVFDPPLNQRGYVVDKWQPPTPEERVNVIATIAQSAFDNQHAEYTLMHARLTLLQTLIRLLPISKGDAGLAGKELAERMEQWGYAL